MTRMQRLVRGSLTGPVVLGSQPDGTPVVPDPTPLTRLHFFDGRLLKGDDLTVEQDAERALAMLIAQSGGPGIAWGLDVDQSGETLTVSAGLAFDPQGRPLLLPSTVQLGVADLLGTATTSETGGSTGSSLFGPCALGLPVEATVDPIASATPYLLTVGWLEGYCGTMDIYGASCEQACVSGTDRPYRVDGMVFRLRPVQLTSPLPSSRSVSMAAEHLRSRIASAYFADERAAAGTAISAASLASSAWCHGGAEPSGSEVPLAMVVRMGSTTVFVDEWAARRERLQPPPRVGFDGRLAMRARAVWDAQIAQFQCELADRLAQGGLPSTSRRLVDAGIVELPPCGYLPVDPGSEVVSLVTAMMGDGVDLRFVAVAADAVANELEVVTHRDRISLVTGLDSPEDRPPVDILVPDGTSATTSATGQLFRVEASYDRIDQESAPVQFSGAARLAPRGTGFTLSAAALAGVTSQDGARRLVSSLPGAITKTARSSALHRGATGASTAVSLDALRPLLGEVRNYVDRTRAGERAAFPSAQFARDAAKPIAARAVLTVDRNPWTLGDGESAFVHLAADLMTPVSTGGSSSVDLIGQLSVEGGAGTGDAGTRQLRFTGQLSTTDNVNPPQLVSLDRSATVSRTGTSSGGPDTYLVAGIEELLRLIRLTPEPATVFAQFVQRSDWLRLVADETVADPNSLPRQNADMALSLLRAARPQDPQFLERGQAATFGRVYGAAAGTTAMIAGRDWVAFRRRPPQPPAVVAPPATVAVYAYPAKDSRDAKLAAHNAESGEAPVSWQRVATAEFDATSGAMTTPAQVLQDGWTATGAGEQLVFAGYAPSDLPSAPSRVAAVFSALAPVVQGSMPPRPLPQPPAGYVDPRDDGSIFLVAMPKQQTVTPVLQVVGFDRVQDNSQAGELYKLLLLNTPHRAELAAAIGSVVKDFGTIELVDGNPDENGVQTVEELIAENVANADPQESFPVLWVDRDWANAEPDQARTVLDLAERVASDAARDGHVLAQVRQVVGAVGTDPTPAVLVEVYRTRLT